MIKILELDKRIGSSMWTANFRYFDWLGLASIGANIGSSLIGGLASNKMSKEQIQLTRDLFDENWFNQHQANRLAFNRSANFEREMFDKENLYNSPIELLKRFEAAGINPQVAMSGSLGSASSQSASAGNAVSPAGAPGGIPQVPRESSPFETISASMKTALPELFSLLKTKADIDNTRADTEKKGAETEGQKQENEIRDKTMDSFIDSLIAKYNLSTELDTLRETFATQQVNNEQQLLVNKLAESAANAIRLESEGHESAAREALLKVQKDFESEKYEFFKEQKPYALDTVKESLELIKEKKGTEKSIQSKNYAEAGKTNEETYQLQQMRDDLIGITNTKAQKDKLDLDYYQDIANARVQRYLREGKITYWQAEAMKHKAHLAAQENDTYKMRLVFDGLVDVANAAGNLISPF